MLIGHLHILFCEIPSGLLHTFKIGLSLFLNFIWEFLIYSGSIYCEYLLVVCTYIIFNLRDDPLR